MTCFAGIRHGFVPEKAVECRFRAFGKCPPPSVLAPKTEFSNQLSKSGSAYE
jgi:hypothetical protein